MQKSLVKIQTINRLWECEDCGFIEDDFVTVYLPNGKTILGFHDDHLGGGNWSGDLSTVYCWILESLGYFIVLNDKSVYQPHMTKNYETSFYDPSELFMGPLHPIYLTISYENKKIVEDNEVYEWSEPDFFTIKFPTETIVYGSKEGMTPFDAEKGDIYEKIIRYFFDIEHKIEKDDMLEYENNED